MEEQWLLQIMRECNVPSPSVKSPEGEREGWTNKSLWSLRTRGNLLKKVSHKDVLLKRRDVVVKACEDIRTVRAVIVKHLDTTKKSSKRGASLKTIRSFERKEWEAPLFAARRAVSIVKNDLTKLLLTHDTVNDYYGDDASQQKFNAYDRSHLLWDRLKEEAEAAVPRLEKELGLAEKKLAKKPDDDALKNEVKSKKIKLSDARAAATLELCSYVKSAVSQEAQLAYSNWRRVSLKNDVPNMRPNQPIPLRAGTGTKEWDVQPYKFRAEKSRKPKNSKPLNKKVKLEDGEYVEKKGYKVIFKVCNKTGWQEGSLRIKGGKDFATLNLYLRGEASRRNARLFYDKALNKWVISMTFGIPRKPPKEGGISAALRVGVTDFLFLLDENGRTHRIDRYHKALHELGSSDAFNKRDGVIARKLQFKQAKTEAGRDLSTQGKGARGHGKARFYRLYRRQADKERNYFNTWKGQMGAAVRRVCRKHNITTLYVGQMTTAVPQYILDDYMPEQVAWLIKRFPFAGLREAAVRATEKDGIAVVVTSDDRDCDTCPACGHIDVQNHNPQKAKFWCVSCDMRLDADFVAAWNYLKKNGVDCSKIADVARYIQGAYEAASNKAKRIEKQEQAFIDAHKSIASSGAAE